MGYFGFGHPRQYAGLGLGSSSNIALSPEELAALLDERGPSLIARAWPLGRPAAKKKHERGSACRCFCLACGAAGEVFWAAAAYVGNRPARGSDLGSIACRAKKERRRLA